jgi:hypothetical protein
MGVIVTLAVVGSGGWSLCGTFMYLPFGGGIHKDKILTFANIANPYKDLS